MKKKKKPGIFNPYQQEPIYIDEPIYHKVSLVGKVYSLVFKDVSSEELKTKIYSLVKGLISIDPKLCTRYGVSLDTEDNSLTILHTSLGIVGVNIAKKTIKNHTVSEVEEVIYDRYGKIIHELSATAELQDLLKQLNIKFIVNA